MAFSLHTFRQMISFAFSLLSHPATARTTAARRSSIRLPKCSPTIADHIDTAFSPPTSRSPTPTAFSPPMCVCRRSPTPTASSPPMCVCRRSPTPTASSPPMCVRRRSPTPTAFSPPMYVCRRSPTPNASLRYPATFSKISSYPTAFLPQRAVSNRCFYDSAHSWQYTAKFVIADRNSFAFSLLSLRHPATARTTAVRRSSIPHSTIADRNSSAPISNLRLPISAHPFAFYRTIRSRSNLITFSSSYVQRRRPRSVTEEEATKGAFMCYLCPEPKTFSSAEELSTHYEIEHNEVYLKGYSCKCGAYFVDGVQRAMHGCILREVEHNDPDKRMSLFKRRMVRDMNTHGAQKFRCPVTGCKTFCDSPMKLHEHLIDHFLGKTSKEE